MPTYGIYFNTGASFYVEVEAEDENEAIDKAYELPMPYANIHNGFDIGDWEADEQHVDLISE